MSLLLEIAFSWKEYDGLPTKLGGQAFSKDGFVSAIVSKRVIVKKHGETFGELNELL